MQFQSFLASLALVALTSATAIPTTVERRVVEAPNDLEKRADLGVYVCTDRNFQGHCVHITAQAGVCGKFDFLTLQVLAQSFVNPHCLLTWPHTVPLGSDLDNLISSLGPDQGATCYFF